MNFSNYGYRSPSSRPPSAYSPQFSSTPSNPRFLMPRFGYSSIPSYPRPRSSASKPNPDSFSEETDSIMDNRGVDYEYPDGMDAMKNQFGNSNSNMNSMRNNFGSPDTHRGDSNASRDNPFSNQNSFQSPNSSAFYSCNDTFSDSPKYSPAGTPDHPNYLNEFSPFKNQNQNSMYGMNNGNADRFQNKSNQNFKHSSTGKAKEFFPKKINPNKKKMAPKSEWRCSLCSIDFTSNIPFEMHLRGARHAKKMKTRDVLQSIQKQVALSKDIAPIGNSFRCDLCNVHANSSLQFQTHLDGTKHKGKLLQAQHAKEKKVENKPETESSQVNGKSNGSTVRSLPSDFGEPQPAKLAKYSCDICSIIVNSETQLQQHLTSKKHQAKAEGKPLQKKKFQKKTETEEAMEQGTDDAGNTTEVPETAQVDTKTVVGVKNLSSSFIQGETLQ